MEEHGMSKILLINTGGTFNKYYDPANGSLEVAQDGKFIQSILQKWQCEIETLNIIGKDSLYMNTQDRIELLAAMSMDEHEHVIVVHGTDTIHITAEYLADAELDKRIVLTGAMVPYAIDPVEATANLASAVGYLQTVSKSGVYIAMNGVFGRYDEIRKERSLGKFIRS